MKSDRLTKAARCWLPLVAAALLAAGCSTVDSGEFAALQGNVAREQMKLRELTKRVDMLSRSVEGSRAPQAGIVADMDSMRQDVARLQGQLEEMGARRGGDEETKDFERRLARVEAYLGMSQTGPGAAAPAAPAAPGKAPVVVEDEEDQPRAKPKPAPAPAPEAGAQTADGLWTLAHRLYQQKSYQPARDRLEDFLKKYPKDKRADDAQFLVGETLYAERKYEESILAYNQVVKRSPNSNKAPAALLKQGMAFSELGDKRTAKIVLGKLVKTYPNSSEAKTAEKLMAKMP